MIKVTVKDKGTQAICIEAIAGNADDASRTAHVLSKEFDDKIVSIDYDNGDPIEFLTSTIGAMPVARDSVESAQKSIETTAWAIRFKKECPTSYAEAIKHAETLTSVSIEHCDDHSSQGDFLWAIIPDTSDDFWLDALPTKEDALSVCQEMKWEIID